MRKTMYFKFFLMACLSLALFTSCSDDDDFSIDDDMENPQNGEDPDDGENPDDGEEPENGPYAQGFFVLNEGSQSAGTVTYVSSDYSEIEQNLFTTVNPDAADLGLYAQSMFFDDNGHAYIISNGSNLITVVNRSTFELIGTIDSELNAPRYGVVENGKAYVTNAADFSSSTDDYVAVIDLENLEVEETVDIGAVTEHILEEDGLIYIENAAFGSGNQISVFDPTTNQVTQTISTANGLNSMSIEEGSIYALSNDTLQRIDLGNLNVSSQVAFDYTNEAGETLTTSNLDIENDQIYYTVGSAVYSINISATTPAESPLLSYNSDSQYGVFYGFEVENNRIYIADGGDFASDSFIKIYGLSGSELETIDVGVGPNGFYFND